MTQPTPSLAKFLLARIAEDAAVARAAVMYRSRVFGDDASEVAPDFDMRANDDLAVPAVVVGAERVLAECAAKRRAVKLHDRCGSGIGYCDDGGHGWGDGDPLGCADLADLAAPYADHPDYRQEWAV